MHKNRLNSFRSLYKSPFFFSYFQHKNPTFLADERWVFNQNKRRAQNQETGLFRPFPPKIPQTLSVQMRSSGLFSLRNFSVTAESPSLFHFGTVCPKFFKTLPGSVKIPLIISTKSTNFYSYLYTPYFYIQTGRKNKQTKQFCSLSTTSLPGYKIKLLSGQKNLVTAGSHQ